MPKPRPSLALFFGAILAVALVLSLPGCSRVRLAYGSADLLLINYADGYLGLESEQRGRWEPVLQRGLADHRRNGLPYLAAFFDRAHQVSQAGFPAAETACLVRSARDLYRVHARLAVEVAAPLLADLESPQVRALKVRFARDLEEDRSQARSGETESRERARRYVRTIEDWTGPLSAEQRALVADITRRMPDTRRAVLDYRTRKRDGLIALLETGTDAQRLKGYLSAWLVDFQDLPPELGAAGDLLAERLVELVTRLGQGLTETQRGRLERRLSALRSDLLKLQDQPRLAPMGC